MATVFLHRSSKLYPAIYKHFRSGSVFPESWDSPPFILYSCHVAATLPATNDRAADVFAASQGETHDGESGRRMGHSGAFSGEARPLSGEGPQPRGHAATCSRHQAR